jgi:hypothetical protein
VTCPSSRSRNAFQDITDCDILAISSDLAATAVPAFIVMTAMLSASVWDKHREASAADDQQDRDDDILYALLHRNPSFYFFSLSTIWMRVVREHLRDPHRTFIIHARCPDIL